MMPWCVAFAILLPAADPPPAVPMVLTTKGAVTVERSGKSRRPGDMDLPEDSGRSLVRNAGSSGLRMGVAGSW
jgi:hypothetical protein